jgi:phage anti-repressor protein
MYVTQKNSKTPKHSKSLVASGSRNELIQIQAINGEQLIDGRELHEFLSVKTKFTQWFSIRINEYKFKENIDFFASQKIEAKNSRGGHNSKDFMLTLDMAKELAMIERNEKGRQIRQYFIACEKKLRSQIEALPSINQNLKGIKPIRMNGLKLYPLTEVRTALGISYSMNQAIRQKYQQHFVLFNNKKYCTEDYANHIAHQRAVSINRKVLQAQQGVLPLNFGDNTNLLHA